MKILLVTVLSIMLFPLHAFTSDKGGAGSSVKIRLVFDAKEVVVSMFDNPASRDFLSLLPLEAEFKDFAGEEKIAYLPRKLDTSGSPTPSQEQGDFTYYRPWGNIAVFYHGFGSSGQLTVLGRIESGKNLLGSMSGPFTARIERVE
jgi:Uncharacterized conserved protein